MKKIFDKKAYDKQWRADHPEYGKQRYMKHRIDILERKRQYYQDHKVKINESRKQYYQEYYLEHKAEIARRKRQWGAEHPLLNVWYNIRQRCLNPNRKDYKHYGGRGIKCVWLSFKSFEKWCLGNGWQKGLTIDRINNDGDYSPDNCQFITKSENSRKKKLDRNSGI